MVDQQESSDSPKWLKYVEEMIKEEGDEIDSEARYYEVVRDMLLQEDDPDKAVEQAIQRFYDDYVAGVSKEQYGFTKPPEYGAGGALNSLSVIVFELGSMMPFADPKQDTLAKFLIGIAKNAAEEFDEKNPRFVYWDWGIQSVAVDWWNGCHIDSGPMDREGPSVDEAINTWLSTTALLAKFFQADLLGIYGPAWVVRDFRDAFETQKQGDVTKHAVRQAQILATANYILLAGDALAKEAKISSPKRTFELGPQQWKLWASKLKEVADTVDETARWNLKERAQEAHDKMVELYPEAFE